MTILEQALAEVDAIVADLELATPRLTLTANYGERTSSGSKTAPVPVDVAALDAKFALHKWLVSQCARLQEPFRTRPNGTSPRSIESLSSHLLYHLSTIVLNGWCDEMGAQLRDLLDQCVQVTHKAANQEFAGTCQTEGCGAEMWVKAGADEARCGVCSAEYTQVREWRNGAREYARSVDDEVVGYPTALSIRLKKIHGIDITPAHISMLADRGHLARANPERGADGKKLRAMFKLGDVRKLLTTGTTNPGMRKTA